RWQNESTPTTRRCFEGMRGFSRKNIGTIQNNGGLVGPPSGRRRISILNGLFAGQLAIHNEVTKGLAFRATLLLSRLFQGFFDLFDVFFATLFDIAANFFTHNGFSQGFAIIIPFLLIIADMAGTALGVFLQLADFLFVQFPEFTVVLRPRLSD